MPKSAKSSKQKWQHRKHLSRLLSETFRRTRSDGGAFDGFPTGSWTVVGSAAHIG